MTMTMARRRCLLLAAAAGIGAALPSAASAAVAQPGDTIDWPPLRLLGGGTLAASAWHGTASVLVLWATWCAYCQRHNAQLDKLQRAIAGRPLRIIGVATDGDEALVRRSVAQRGYTFPVTLDAEPLRSRLTARRSVPMTFVIDARGRLKQAIPGEMTESDVLGLASLALASG